MKPFFKSKLAAVCLLAGLGFAGSAMAFGQGGGGMGGGGMGGMHGMHGEGHGKMGGHGPRDPAKRQERMNQHLGELKAKLQITAAQEGAWTAFTANMQAPAGKGPMSHADHKKMAEEMQKLTTPERIDRMKAMRAERQAMMDKRAEGVKAFYAALTPEQRKVFDAESHGHMGRQRG
jgi:periplasmic protein CpxP/Spy